MKTIVIVIALLLAPVCGAADTSQNPVTFAYRVFTTAEGGIGFDTPDTTPREVLVCPAGTNLTVARITIARGERTARKTGETIRTDTTVTWRCVAQQSIFFVRFYTDADRRVWAQTARGLTACDIGEELFIPNIECGSKRRGHECLSAVYSPQPVCMKPTAP